MVDTTSPKASSVPAPSATGGAGAPEVEITSEMIEVGVRVLWESGAVESANLGADQELVREMFLRMSLVLRDRS
jgi:hypothetical protein